MENKKHGFGSSIGFILAAAGSAVGLGNLWAFPYKTSANGGAAFVLVYILCVLVIGSIAMISEIYLGKRSMANTVTAYKKANKNLGFLGLIVILVPTLIVCYYGVLGGWTLRFAVNSFQSVEQASNAMSFSAFASHTFEPIFYTLIFMLLAAVIIMAGIKDGIEKSSKVLMPTLFIILVFIAIYCLFLGEGVKNGLAFYLKPDFSSLGFNGVVAAMGQAFFSLSIGMGTLIAYGSYTGKEIKVGQSTFMICLFDTLVALISGLAIFSAIGALQPESLQGAQGVGLIYQILPQIFAKMGDVGQIVSFLFFTMVVIAALTSVISILEVSVQFITQKFKLKRKKTTLVMTLICFVVSIPVAWSVGGAFQGKLLIFGFDILTFLDEIANTVLMPLGAIGACLTVGWLIDKKKTANPFKTLKNLEKDGLSLGKFGKVFVIMAKYVTPVLMIFVEIMGVKGKFIEFSAKGLNYLYVVIASIIIIAILIFLYFAFLKNTFTGDNSVEELLESEQN